MFKLESCRKLTVTDINLIVVENQRKDRRYAEKSLSAYLRPIKCFANTLEELKEL